MIENVKHRPIAYTAQPLAHSISPHQAALITLKTLPNANCVLHDTKDSNPDRGLSLYADQDGLIRFYVHPHAQSEHTGEVVIDCEVDGKITRFPVHLRPSPHPTASMPLPVDGNPKPRREDALVRPALAEREWVSASDEELQKSGYPLRPDADEAPHAFNAWRTAVSMPATLVTPRMVARPGLTHDKRGVTHGPATSSNWSGFELRGAGPYDWVTGMWRVPQVFGIVPFVNTYSSYWVGLDGDGTSDLVQAGTEQEVLLLLIPPIGFMSFASYYAWTEFLPQQPTEQQLAGFPISPGDEIFTQVWIGNAGSSPTLSGFFGVMFIQNMTTSEYTYTYTPVGTTKVGGSEAVWIMERPTVGGSLPFLADFGSTDMYNAYARKANSPRHSGYVPYQGDTNLQISMTSGASTLATVAPLNTYAMRFSWHSLT